MIKKISDSKYQILGFKVGEDIKISFAIANYIKDVSKVTALQCCKALKISPNILVKNLESSKFNEIEIWIKNNMHVAKPRSHKTKIQRPTYEELKKDILSIGMTKTAKKYNVAYSSIKRWVLFYERNLNGRLKK